MQVKHKITANKNLEVGFQTLGFVLLGLNAILMEFLGQPRMLTREPRDQRVAVVAG